MLWYSIIHTPPAGQAFVFTEVARVLRPGGHVLVSFHPGEGVRDMSAAYSRFGHEVRLERHLYTADQVAARLSGRRPAGGEPAGAEPLGRTTGPAGRPAGQSGRRSGSD